MNQECRKILSVYIHIPFCKSKCHYCDFASEPLGTFLNGSLSCEEEYIKALLTEIEKEAIILKDEYLVKTIYIGGGTPSIIHSNYIKQILDKIYLKFNICNDVEITVEANPDSITQEKLREYKLAEINRLSIGMQSTNNKLLKIIGRPHTYEQFEKAYKLARIVGFKNVNVDVMFGLPNQTLEDIEETLSKVIKLNPEHISCYSLILEEGTKLYEQVNNGRLKVPDENTERNMYYIIKNKLKEAGYKHYEISNFAKPNYESKHNMMCWEQKEYMGFGAAAHSYRDGARYSNTTNIQKYILDSEKIIHETQTIEDTKKEYILLGLRKLEGIYIDEYIEKFHSDLNKDFEKEIGKLQKLGLLEKNDKNIFLSNKGLDLANVVWQEFV